MDMELRFSMPGLKMYRFDLAGNCYVLGQPNKRLLRRTKGRVFYLLADDKGGRTEITENEIKAYGRHVEAQKRMKQDLAIGIKPDVKVISVIFKRISYYRDKKLKLTA